MLLSVTEGAVSVVAFFFWAATSYFLRSTIPRPQSLADQPETGKLVLNYYCNYNSLLHCLYLLGGAIFCLFKYPFVQNRKMKKLELLVIRISMAYYLFDTVNGVFFDYNDFWMNVHHVLVFSAYFHSLYYETLASEMMATIVIGEISNPFLILMKTSQYEGNKQISMIMGAGFVITYLILRGYVALKLARRVCLSNAENLLKVCCCCTMFVSYYWLYEIFTQIGKRLLPLITPKTATTLGSGSGDIVQPAEALMIGGLTVDQVTRGLWIIFCIYYCIGLGVRGIFLKERIPEYCSSGHKFSILD